MSHKIGWGSCEDRVKVLHAGYHMVSDSYTAFFGLGDLPYLGNNQTKWGSTSVALNKGSSVADISTHYNQMWSNPGWAALNNSSIEIYMMSDDHEWMGDNWDGGIAQANASADGLGLTNDLTGQTEANTHHARARAAWLAMISTYANNPANADSEAVAQVAPAATTFGATPTASDYEPIYYRVMKDIDGNTVSSNPVVEYFVIDCISHRSLLADTDNASKSLLGTTQKAWLKSRLLASTATFKVIMSPKKTYKNSGADNTDTWGEYTTERDEILAFIDSNNITGVLWCAGDRHTPSIIKTTKTAGDTYDHLCVVACPISVSINAGAANTTLTDNTVQYFSGSEDKVFGELCINSGYIDIKLRNSFTGKTMWKGRLLSGENKLDESPLKVAI